MKLTPRYGTKKAIDELSEELNLPNEAWMQDWPMEVIESSDIDKYIEHYEQLSDDDKKFVLMKGIIHATEIIYETKEELFIKYWNKVKPILKKTLTFTNTPFIVGLVLTMSMQTILGT